MDSQNTLVGQTLAGRYQLVKLIGQGGMGSVYKGLDHQMSDRVIAVKVLAPHLVSDEKQVMRFEQEARAASQLRHPNTISVLDFGRSPDGHIFMIIEFLTGETLTNVLRRGRVETARALYMMRQVCKSLAEAHSKGIIHRDLKPDNIFVCEIYGEKDFIKVIDFGIAKFLEAGGAELTQAGKMFGTPRYLSPEQAQGLPLTAASDLYALGVILFEMLCGRPPFVAEDPIAVAIKHVQEAPPSFAEVAPDVYVPDEVDHIVFKLLAKKPTTRFQSSEEVVAAIDAAMMPLSGNRHPSGHFTPAAAMTPARPAPAVPRRGTIPPPSMQQPTEAEKTRAIDSLSAAAGLDPERTVALDQIAIAPAAPAAEKTLALDAHAAQAAIAEARRTAGDKAKAAAAPAPAASGAQRNLMYLLILALLAVGAIVAVAFTQREEADARPRPPVQLAAAAPAPTPDPPAPVAPAPAVEAAPKPKEHSITLQSIPPGANVTINGLPVGKTPFPLKMQPDVPNQTVVLQLEDYEDYSLETSALLKAAMAGVTSVPAELKARPKAAVKQVRTGNPRKPKEKDWE